MTKKSILAISTIAVSSLAGVQAGIRDCYMASSNCTGYYYEDIRAAFVDCHDSTGSLVNREEQFYKSALEKECNSTQWSDLLSDMNMTAGQMNPAEMQVDSNQTVNYCDYYQQGKGYQFTQVDSGIGLIVNMALEGGARDLYWQNYNASTNSSQPSNGSFWSWTELASLINQYSNEQCQANSSNSTNSSSGETPEGGDVWNQLNISWS